MVREGRIVGVSHHKTYNYIGSTNDMELVKEVQGIQGDL